MAVETNVLTNINRCSQETFDSIVSSGTLPSGETEEYDEKAMYAVELDDPLQVGVSGSGLEIDNNVLKNSLLCTQTTTGTYVLKATVDSSGNVTYSWEAE